MSGSPKPVKKVPIHLQSAQNRLYIKNGEVVNHDNVFKADVYIEDGRIKYVGDASGISVPGGVRVIDASGKLVIPGGVDPHTHMELKFGGTVAVDDFYHGTKAAIAGGTTTIIDFVLPNKGESLIEAYDKWRSLADPKVCCDYSLHMGITWWSQSVSDEIEIVCKELGINSFKMFMAYKGLYQISDSDMLEALDKIRHCEAIALVHAENGDIIAKNVAKLLAAGVTGPEGHELSRQEEVEAEAVNRACVLAHQMNAMLYISSITSKISAEIVGQARRNGYNVFGETLASCVGCSLNAIPCSDKINYITSPPIRNASQTPEQLLKALAYDDLQTTASDNCTFTKNQKEMGKLDFSKIPNGVNGVEDRMSIVWEKGVHSGILDPSRFVAITSTNAAKIFNLYPQKGRIAPGSDADIVIWNANATRKISKDTHHHACDFNIFEDMICHGCPDIVIANGRICAENNVIHVAQGFGRFLSRETRSPFVYDLLEEQSKFGEEVITNKHVSENTNKGEFPHQESVEKSLLAEDLEELALFKSQRNEGHRNLQESTFSLTEELDKNEQRACIKVRNPPGGKSSGFW